MHEWTSANRKILHIRCSRRITAVRECTSAFEKASEIIDNDQGDRAEEHSTISGNSVMPIGVAFSIGDGTLIREKSDVPQPTPFDTPQLSVVRYAYQYDDQGNWTQQTANYGPHSGGPSNMRNRKLRYYGNMRLPARTPPIISCVSIREYIKRR